MQLDGLKWDRDGLVTVVVQDRLGGELRMLAHASREAVAATLETGYAHFFSRSRQRLWRKGETSGHEIRVFEIWADCDADALVYLSDCTGPSCHTGRDTCFFRRAGSDAEFQERSAGHAQPVFARLWSELDARRSSTAASSYTRSLLDAGIAKIGAKITEEANELVVALAGESDDRVASEAADVMYHVLVGLLARGVTLADLERELARRSGTSGLLEKASRSTR